VSNIDLPESTVPQLAVKLKTAGFMIDSGETKVRELIDKEELDSFMDDGVRKVTVASIHRYIAKKIAAKETDRAKTAAAVEASLKLARKRRLEKAREIGRSTTTRRACISPHVEIPRAVGPREGCVVFSTGCQRSAGAGPRNTDV
jgi:hypothetical protein